MVELHVLAGVEGFVEDADRIEHGTAIGDGDALRRDVAFSVGVDERRGVMAKARRAGGGDGTLERAGAGHVQRLRPANAIGLAALKGGRYLIKVMRIRQLAMAVDQDDQVAARCRYGSVAA